jgi:tRNA modification GTPase
MDSIIEMEDTVAAVSTALAETGSAGRAIIRVSGPGAFKAVSVLLIEPVRFEPNRIVDCRIRPNEQLALDAKLYCFREPHSYTGQDLCEIHIEAGAAALELLTAALFRQARPAGPGEFTQRAYLNGKLDLTQAEAVAEIISSANAAQLGAAQRLLEGRFAETIGRLRDAMLELLGKLEAGLDFSQEEIEFVTHDEAARLVTAYRQQLEGLLNGSIQCERMIDLDSVGLAGVPNAGKSSLLNALLGKARSIVSEQEATTRDVLTGVLRLKRLDCVLFDCAGLMPPERQRTVVDQLSHAASLEALNSAALVVFCMDASKEDVTPDMMMRKQITASRVIYVATKADLAGPHEADERCQRLSRQLGAEVLMTSARTQAGLDALKDRVEAGLLALRAGDAERQDRLAINQRHRNRLEEAIKALDDCAEEISSDADEVAAMFLRQAYETLGGLEHENVDEAILERIFSRFCIGK